MDGGVRRERREDGGLIRLFGFRSQREAWVPGQPERRREDQVGQGLILRRLTRGGLLQARIREEYKNNNVGRTAQQESAGCTG